MCETVDLGPPMNNNFKNRMIRECMDACEFNKEHFQQVISHEADLLRMLIRLGNSTTPCLFDLYARYLNKINHCWSSVIWNELTRHVISLKLRPSHKSLEILEDIISEVHSRNMSDLKIIEDYEVELVEHVCHIFTYSGHVNPDMISKLYTFVDFTDEMEPVETVKHAVDYLTSIKKVVIPKEFTEIEEDIQKWSEEGILEKHRLRRLIFFKLQLRNPAENELFNRLYCDFLIGDSKMKTILVNNFELYNRKNKPDPKVMIRSLMDKNLLFASLLKWDLVALNLEVLSQLVEKKYMNDIVLNLEECLKVYNRNNCNDTFTLLIFEILEFMHTHHDRIPTSQQQKFINYLDLFSTHLESSNSCLSLDDDQCQKLILFAFETNEKNIPQYQRLTRCLTRSLQREMIKEHRIILAKDFEEHWISHLDTPERARSFCSLFGNSRLWDIFLKSPLRQLSHVRIQILNKLLLNHQMYSTFIPNTDELDHIKYVAAIASYPYVAVFHKGKPQVQDFFTFSFVVNRILENLGDYLSEETVPVELNPISIFFSKIALYYAQNAHDVEFPSYKCMMNVIVMTAKENDYDQTVLEATKLFMRKKLYVHSSKQKVAIFALLHLLKIMEYIMSSEESHTYDFSDPLDFYLNAPFVRESPQLSLHIQNTKTHHEFIKAEQSSSFPRNQDPSEDSSQNF